MATICCKEMQFSEVHAVLFDKDGTLANAEDFLRSLGQRRSRLIDAQVPGVQEPLLMAFGLEGDRLNPTGLLAVGTRRENEIAAAAYVAETGRGWLESLELVQNSFQEADKYMQRKADYTPLLNDALELLHKLQTAGIKLGIVSSDTPQNLEDFVQRYSLEPYFSVLVGATDYLEKPDPRLLQQACAALNVAPENTLVIGDAPSDMRMGKAAGAMGCIGIVVNPKGSYTLKDADVVITRLKEVEVFP